MVYHLLDTSGLLIIFGMDIPIDTLVDTEVQPIYFDNSMVETIVVPAADCNMVVGYIQVVHIADTHAVVSVWQYVPVY